MFTVVIRCPQHNKLTSNNSCNGEFKRQNGSGANWNHNSAKFHHSIKLCADCYSSRKKWNKDRLGDISIKRLQELTHRSVQHKKCKLEALNSAKEICMFTYTRQIMQWNIFHLQNCHIYFAVLVQIWGESTWGNSRFAFAVKKIGKSKKKKLAPPKSQFQPTYPGLINVTCVTKNEFVRWQG